MNRTPQTPDGLGWDGVFPDHELPLLIQRRGMAVWENGAVVVLNRRQLPHRTEFMRCTTVEEVARAIEQMLIQGAVSLSFAGGYGLALAFTEPGAPKDRTAQLTALHRSAERLRATRKTGLFLGRIIDRATAAAEHALASGDDPVRAVVHQVDRWCEQHAARAYQAGQHASELLKDGDTVLTHCFADRAFLYTLMEAKRQGKALKVLCSETRPYLQGARLTSLSVQQIGFPATLISDNMGGFCISQGKVSALMTAADHVCLDGTVCNKVGTYQYAVCAHITGVPFYVVRTTGPDPESRTAADVHIEYRNPDEVLFFNGERIAPPGVDALYPAFDITPPQFVTAIVTDKGAYRPTEIARYLGGESL